MALCKCIDCGNELSPTATGCNKCNSTDPFGIRRANVKFQNILMFGLLVLMGGIWLAFHFDILTFEMVKNFLYQQTN